MSEFLLRQLEKKVDRFFENRSDGFIVAIIGWFSFGDGPLKGSPDPEYVTQEDFDYLVKEIIGEEALVNLISDMRGENKSFRRMSLTERGHMSTLHSLFMAQTYHALRKNVLQAKIAACNVAIEAQNKKLRRIEREIKKATKDMAEKTAKLEATTP